MPTIRPAVPKTYNKCACVLCNSYTLCVYHCQLTNPSFHINWHGSWNGGIGSLLQLTLGVGHPPPVQFTVTFPGELRGNTVFFGSGCRING